MNRPVIAPQLRSLSVFTGLGGLDLGLEAAGFTTLGAIENDEVARRSLKVNRPDWKLVEPGDVMVAAAGLEPSSLRLGIGQLDLLAGAPPCQPYSKASMWAQNAWRGADDPRALPLEGFLDLAERFLPRAILIENVPGFMRGRHSMLDRVTERLGTIGRVHNTTYRVAVRVLDAADFGVPQHRQRAIVVATRSGVEFAWPDLANRKSTAWDALAGLEIAEPPLMTGRWADLLPSIPEGCNYLHHTDRGDGISLFGYRTRYWSFLLKLAKDRPSWTIPAQPGPSAGPFHWDDRPLAVEELLRLQSFPADWFVDGNRREQVRQIGNATPPLLAEHLGRELARSLGSRPSGKFRYGVPSAGAPPAPDPPRPVPRRYLRLVGAHEPHPGTGRGPRPRAETT